MNKLEIKNIIATFLKEAIKNSSKLQYNSFYEHIIKNTSNYSGLDNAEKGKILEYLWEIIHEMLINGIMYQGSPGDVTGTSLVFLTITEYGKECLLTDNVLPYDPEGYLKELQEQNKNLDLITLTYVSEAVNAFSRRLFLSATVMLGVASENLINILVDSYTSAIAIPNDKANFKKKITGKGIHRIFKEFKTAFDSINQKLPKVLTDNSDIYLDNIFNLIRYNRNNTGHPTGKKATYKSLYASLQIFAEYSKLIFDLKDYFDNNKI
jgi:hypothetical protein